MKCFYSIKLLFSIFLLLASIGGFSQSKYQNIAIFDKVWGFMKYHHSAVANGTINWDSVYIAHINKVISAKNSVQLNNELSALINAAGQIPNTKVAQLPDSIFTQNHDLKWLQTSLQISKQNRQKLQFIYEHRNRGNNRFIFYNNYSDYSGEKKCENMGLPNVKYRLLFLSRFWNAINYFDPYKYIAGENWNLVLARFIPKLIYENDTLSYYKTLMQLSASLNDGHAHLSINNGQDAPIRDLVFGKYTAPIYATVIDGTATVRKTANDSLCNLADIKKGDIILSINDETVTKKAARINPYISASNEASRNVALGRLLFNTHDTYQRLRIKRGRKVFTAKVRCILNSEKNWGDINNYTANNTGYKTIGNSIAYVYAMQVWGGNMDTIKALIRSKKAVIFDGRNYQNNGDVFYSLFDIFMPEPKLINLATRIMPADPGYFKWWPSGKIGGFNKTPYNGKVIILVDERAQSQGEYTAMALQAIPNSVTIGSQTSGLDGTVSYIPMGGWLSISYSGYGIYYPDKTPTQRRGVKIDIPVKKTVESVVKDEDLALEEALKYLRKRGID
jgi:carboxyl-terminal processing protease